MPIHLSSISATFFINLLNRLGVKPPPPDGFDLINTVQPVSIVDQDVALNVATTEPAFALPFGGVTAAPGAAAVVADTGALAAGQWEFYIILNGVDTTVILQCEIQHRDAANAANIWAGRSYGAGTTGQFLTQYRFGKTVAINERIRIVNITAAGAGGSVTALIFARQIA